VFASMSTSQAVPAVRTNAPIGGHVLSATSTSTQPRGTLSARIFIPSMYSFAEVANNGHSKPVGVGASDYSFTYGSWDMLLLCKMGR
jgi:hypothetical protein